jgi:hypothetical protein
MTLENPPKKEKKRSGDLPAGPPYQRRSARSSGAVAKVVASAISTIIV